MNTLTKKIVPRAAVMLLIIGGLVLLPAGTYDFWQFYAYMAVILAPMIFVIHYFVQRDPQFLERRMRMQEKEKQQKPVVILYTAAYAGIYILSGIDHRMGWSDVSIGLVLAADIAVLTSYLFIFSVFRVNSFASRVIEVTEKQTVISTGPYRYIRHPMYLGILVMMLATPIALGSWWALIPYCALPVAIVLRILNEETVLSEQLPGYTDYRTKVRDRLIPFIW